MATIRPFLAIRYARRPGADFGNLIAPPYDILGENDKARLIKHDPNNVVAVDLPHFPPKAPGPDAAYEKSAALLKNWLDNGILIQDPRPAFYPYMQTYEHNGRTFRRRGFFALVKLSPFGAGDVVPHELTYKGPIEDRLKLMRSTAVQLSPIFGLYSDPDNHVSSLLYGRLGRPELSGTLDGVRNDLWSVPDAEVENKVIDLLKSKPIYIADGHHRYTTALQYQADLAKQHGSPLPETHPANWCMFVLVSMHDDGLLIQPTHRLIGGLKTFDISAFKSTLQATFEITDAPPLAQSPDKYLRQVLPKQPPHTFGLFDGRSRKLFQLRLKNPDILAALEPTKSAAWRRLDVAILQRYLIEHILQPQFAPGDQLVRGYTADPDVIAPQVDGQRYQIALLLQSTPLHALEELGKHGEVMPQKSTYFYPKLATGMVIHSLK